MSHNDSETRPVTGLAVRAGLNIETGEISIVILNTSSKAVVIGLNCLGANPDGVNNLLPKEALTTPLQYKVVDSKQNSNVFQISQPGPAMSIVAYRGAEKRSYRVVSLLPGEFFGKNFTIAELWFWDDIVRDISKYGNLRLYPYFEINDENGDSLGIYEGEGVIIDKEILQQLIDNKTHQADAEHNSGK